jgi:hypothetical protein
MPPDVVRFHVEPARPDGFRFGSPTTSGFWTGPNVGGRLGVHDALGRWSCGRTRLQLDYAVDLVDQAIDLGPVVAPPFVVVAGMLHVHGGDGEHGMAGGKLHGPRPERAHLGPDQRPAARQVEAALAAATAPKPEKSAKVATPAMATGKPVAKRASPAKRNGGTHQA